MDHLEIRRIMSSEAEQVAYVTSLAFYNHPVYKAIYQTKDEELRQIIKEDYIDCYANYPWETFIAVLNGKIVGSIRSGFCTGKWHSGHSCSEEEYDYIVKQTNDDLSLEQRWKWLQKTSEIYDITTPHSHMGPLAIIPEHQGKGIGTKLMNDYFIRLNGMASFLETFTESNVRFYGNRGYKVVATDYVLGSKGYFMKRD